MKLKKKRKFQYIVEKEITKHKEEIEISFDRNFLDSP